MKQICFDMDGTLAGLYDVIDWLPMLEHHNPLPYQIADPCLNMSALARLLHKAQKIGYSIIVISWLSKNTSEAYDKAVEEAKRKWLKQHLPSVEFDEVLIVPYGTPKSTLGNGILFDDDASIRAEWKGLAYEPSEIIRILKSLEE